MDGHLADLLSNHSRPGVVEWIGVRPSRKAAMEVLDNVFVSATGLEGDRRASPGKRAVSLIQYEHLSAIAMLSVLESVAPQLLRRNLVVGGINLLALKRARFRIGEAVLEGTGICAPCSRMESNLGHGGYNAVRGHGGITAQVLEEGLVGLGDAVLFEPV